MFDIIVGNPPYQKIDGGYGSSAMPLYDKFVVQALDSSASIVCMIIPSKWFAGGKGLTKFRERLLHDPRFVKIVDYTDASECFPSADIGGGVCYFLWDNNYDGECTISTIVEGEVRTTMKRSLSEWDVLVRHNDTVELLRKILAQPDQQSYAIQVSSRNPFGLATNFTDYQMKQTPVNMNSDMIKLYRKSMEAVWVDKKYVTNNRQWIDMWKVIIPSAYGERTLPPWWITGEPAVIPPGSVCTETYLVVGAYPTKEEAQNCVQYNRSQFFRFLLMLRKNTQHLTKDTYRFVPQLPMTQEWTDESLASYYSLTEADNKIIESYIKSSLTRTPQTVTSSETENVRISETQTLFSLDDNTLDEKSIIVDTVEGK